MEVVQPYNPSMPQDLKDKALSANADALGKINYKAVNLLASLQVKAAQTITSGTFTLLTGLSQTLDTSGGLVLVVATLYGSNGTINVENSFGLFIDGTEKSRKGFIAGARIDGTVTLVWMEKLSSGSHRFEIKALVGGGSMVTPLATSSYTNELFIAEIIL